MTVIIDNSLKGGSIYAVTRSDECKNETDFMVFCCVRKFESEITVNNVAGYLKKEAV